MLSNLISASMAARLISLSAVVYAQPGPVGRVDTHIHALPPAYADALKTHIGEIVEGFPTPAWSMDLTIKSMEHFGTQRAVLSVSTPGVPVVGTGKEGRSLARTLNYDLGNYTVDDERFSFFGTLPDWRDVQGTLEEIDYLYETQQLCHGVAIFSTYGDKLLGDPLFTPIWERLNKYKALLFQHPTSIPGILPAYIAHDFPTPAMDFTLATTRFAVDLVLSGVMNRNPDIDVILSHAGGALPFVANRALGTMVIPDIASKRPLTVDEARRDFGRFYLDTALSTSPAQLDGLLHFTDSSKILFGSDFPYAPQNVIDALTLQYTSFVKTAAKGKTISPDVLEKNGMNLLKRHQQKKKFFDGKDEL